MRIPTIPPPTGSIQMGQSPPDALIPTVNILSDAALLGSTGNDQCALSSQLGDVSQTSVQSSVQSDLSDLVYITDGLPPIPKNCIKKSKIGNLSISTTYHSNLQKAARRRIISCSNVTGKCCWSNRWTS